ncbi:MAG: hypothetical protein RQ875_07695 [Vicingaceae bacterium]|nr:hypothetical protein [Vicingaceae bacterium]
MTTLLFSCQTEKKEDKKELDTQFVEHELQLTTQNTTILIDTVILKESFQEEDEIVNEYLTENLEPIRENFKRINSKINWNKVDTIDVWESTEGGFAIFFYSKNILEKIITRHFGEMGQSICEYYLLNEELSFVFDKRFEYNRPFYWDSIRMKQFDDDQVFDFDKSEIVEERSYFEKGELIHQLNNQDCGSPFSEDYLHEEQLRILKQFNDLLKLVD